MKATCPQCTEPIPFSQINVATDVAACPECGEVFPLSSIVITQDVSPAFDINEPPTGAWFHEDLRGWRIGATTRSSNAFALVPFACLWWGFLLVGILGPQIAKGEFHLDPSLFSIPFFLAGLFLGGWAIMTVCGRIDVIVAGTSGQVFVGVGSLGWTRRFDWSQISQIEEDFLGYQYSGSTGLVISLVGKSRLKIGSMLNDERRYFLIQGLRVLRQRT